MSNRLAYLYFNELDTDDEGTFTTDLSNANSKDVVDFIKLTCNNSNNDIIKRQTDLCRNTVKFGTKIPPLFNMLWSMRVSIYMADTLINVVPSDNINLWLKLLKYYTTYNFYDVEERRVRKLTKYSYYDHFVAVKAFL